MGVVTDALLEARARVLHDLAARGLDTAAAVSVVDEVLTARRWWVDAVARRRAVRRLPGRPGRPGGAARAGRPAGRLCPATHDPHEDEPCPRTSCG